MSGQFTDLTGQGLTRWLKAEKNTGTFCFVGQNVLFYKKERSTMIVGKDYFAGNEKMT